MMRMMHHLPVSQEYKKRSQVSVSETGSELVIGAAGAEDGGEYNCSLTLGETSQSVLHTVVITGVLRTETAVKCHITADCSKKLVSSQRLTVQTQCHRMQGLQTRKPQMVTMIIH